MGKIFSDSATEREFQRKGYVTRPLLDTGDIKALNDLYTALTPEVFSDFHATPFSQDLDYRRRIYEGATAVFQSKLKCLLPHYKLCTAGFVTKRPKSQRGQIQPHQDYTFVDLSRHIDIHVWCPLVDVNAQNGCMKMVAGSHVFRSHASTINHNPKWYDLVLGLLDAEFTTTVPMAAGSALIYDGRLLHSSDENRSEQARLAAACTLIPEQVNPCLYHWNEQVPAQFDLLEVDQTFILRFKPGMRLTPPYPEGVRHLRLVYDEVRQLQAEDLVELRRLQSELRSQENN